MKSLSRRVSGEGQTVYFTEHLEHVDRHGGEHKLRVEVRTDSYREQSHGKVERWDGDRWNEVVWLRGDELKVDTKLGYQRLTPQAREAAFTEDRAVLLRLTQEVLS